MFLIKCSLLYCRLDASLKELTKLIQEVYPETKTKGTTFNFNVTYPIAHQRTYGMKDIGTTTIGSKGPEDAITLKSKQFVIGDYLDVSIGVARGVGNRDSRDNKNNRSNESRRNFRDYR